MKLLLDTHTLLWYVEGDSRLSNTAENLIVDPANDVFISSASYWEIAIKISIGKYRLNRPFSDFIDLCVNRYRFTILPIEPRHAEYVSSLRFPKGHKDPFDRLLVSQVTVDGMSLVSDDPSLDVYGVARLW